MREKLVAASGSGKPWQAPDEELPAGVLVAWRLVAQSKPFSHNTN
jgi:hypothetical protein